MLTQISTADRTQIVANIYGKYLMGGEATLNLPPQGAMIILSWNGRGLARP